MIRIDNDDDDCNVIIINSNNSAKDRASSREEEGVSETTEIAEKVKDAVLQLYL